MIVDFSSGNLKPQACFWLFGFSPEGGTSLPVCVSHRIWQITPITPKQPGTVPAFFKPRIDDCRVMIADF